MPSAVALIPARAGSQRVPGKNVRALSGHPLIAYSISAALESRVFDAVVVSTDSREIADVALHYGAEVPALRPPELATSTSPDVDLVVHMLRLLEAEGRAFDAFSLLRPTSPFRTADTIRRAWDVLREVGDRADSIRAVELCRQHPGKMWVLADDLLEPLLEQPTDRTPYHSSQYQTLPKVYVQNSSLEIAWTHVALELGEIAGPRVAPFFTSGLEGFSIDYPGDVEHAERLVAAGEAALPYVAAGPYALQVA
jgi:CMP-N,N'-diacetyllegionaminic acid synthase